MRPKTARRLKKSWSRMVSTVLALAMLTSLVPVTALPAFAATDVSGGADINPPAYVLNDHTPYAIHYSVSGLAASTSLGLNLRLSKSGVSGGFSDARGFTWNPTLSRWAHTRESAAVLPFPFELVTTDASGTVSGWTYFKCGDENFTGFGNRRRRLRPRPQRGVADRVAAAGGRRWHVQRHGQGQGHDPRRRERRRLGPQRYWPPAQQPPSAPRP